MANKYWVGGGASTNWNATGNTNWSLTSGGANNAAIPTSADTVIFDGVGVNANGTSTISAAITVISINQTGFSGTLVSNQTLTITGTPVTLSATATYSGTTGTLILSGAGTTNLVSNGKTWTAPMTISNGGTKNLIDNWTVNGLVSIGTGTNTLNGNTLVMKNGITNLNGHVQGTTLLDLQGGAWSTATTHIIFNNMNLNGNIAIANSGAGNVTYNTGTLTHVSGTINVVGTLITGGATFNVEQVIWNTVTVNASSTMTLLSPLRGRTLNMGNVNVVFAGAGRFDFDILNYTANTAAQMTLQADVDYQIWETLNISQSRIGTPVAVISSSPTVKAKFFLHPNATCNCNANFTRIDASIEAVGYGVYSRSINTWNGVVTDCININSFTEYRRTALTF